MQQPLQRGLPAEAGIAPEAILNLISAWKSKNLQLHSMMLLRHGKVVAEGWWNPYRPEYTHMLNSLSKSFTSLAVGFAVQEGLLTTEDSVLSFFPDFSVLPDPKAEGMKVKHLLTMSTGHVPNADFAFMYRDPVRAFLNSELQVPPGSRFAYNTAATYMLSAIITRKTGRTVFDYLTPRLFEPLGMTENIWWETCPQGNSMGGFGLNLKTEDLCKTGLFLLNGGVWNGRRLLNEAWIRESTAKHISNNTATQTPWLDTPGVAEEPDTAEPTDWNRGYCYQFWRCNAKNVFRGDGAFGQYIVVMPDQDAVLAITAGENDMQAILTEVWGILLPAMKDAPVPFIAQSQERLAETLGGLSLPVADGTSSAQLPEIPQNGRVYQLAYNEFGIEQIRAEFGCVDRFAVTAHGREYVLTSKSGEWTENHLGFEAACTAPFRLQFFPDTDCCGAWQGPGEYRLKLAATRMAYVVSAALRFDRGRLEITLTQNVGDDRTVVLNGSML